MIKPFLKSLFPDVYSLYFKLLRDNLGDCNTVLDLACGKNSPLNRFEKEFEATGVDIFEPYLVESKEKGYMMTILFQMYWK